MENAIKVGEFKRLLEGVPDDWDLTFGGVLEFYRTKMRGPKLLDIEFNQSIYRDSSGRIVLDDLSFEGR